MAVYVVITARFPCNEKYEEGAWEDDRQICFIYAEAGEVPKYNGNIYPEYPPVF